MPKKKGKTLSWKQMEKMLDGYTANTVGKYLDDAFQKLEERSSGGTAGSRTTLSGGLDRGDHILIDGRTIREIVAEEYAAGNNGSMLGFEGAYQGDRMAIINGRVAEALLEGRHVDVYIPDPVTGKIKNEPSKLQSTGFELSAIERPAQMNRWQKFWSKFGFYRNKVEEPIIYERRVAAQRRVQFYNKVGRAHMAKGSSMAEEVAAAWKEQYPERKNIDMDKIPTREPYHLIRNGMTVWVNCYLATREEGGKLLYTNKQLFDTQDPKMQKARADAAEKIYQHGLTGDVDWLCELQHDSRIALKARIDEQGRKLDFAKGDVTEQEGYREYGMLVSTAYEVTQEIKKTENSLIGKYGDREYNLFQTELADLPNGIGFLEKSLDAQKRMLYGGVDTSDAAREMASVVAGKAILQLCAQKQKAKTAPSEFIKGDEWGPINDLATAVQDHGMKKDIPENYLASVNATEKLGTEYLEATEKIREQIENGTLERRIQTSGVEKGGEFSVTVQDEPPKERRQETGSKEL